MKNDNNMKLSKCLLPLAMIGLILAGVQACGNAKAADQEADPAVFKYREIFLPEGLGLNAGALGLNSLDEDWGIWGHNISKVLPEDHSNAVYAKQNGNTLKKQFCFSSDQLYDYIVEWISSRYKDNERIRFAIVPNDNDIVCLCDICVEYGNTPSNASPAVNHLVRKLAHRFPGHIFYTSDYKTTRGLPTDSMPANTGVLVSAINYPLTTMDTPEQVNFNNRLQAWGLTTPRILVWDYINNFDDYFTPYPTFGVMQKRLRDYRDHNVSAIFLNGSGSDLSAMSRLRTEVLAAMTSDPDIDWKELLKQKANDYYPVTGELISSFMIAQEDSVANNNTVLPLYEGVAIARKTYLPEDAFVNFHDNLLNLRHTVQGEEKKELDILLGELALTRLELKRINGNLYGSDQFINDLESLIASGHPSYNESGWSIDGYIRDYRYLLNHYKESSGNKLKGEKVVGLTPLDPDYSDTSILTDGVLGIPSNYHNGNLIISPRDFTQFAIPNKPGMSKLRVWFSYNPAYKVKLPANVNLKAGGRIIDRIEPQYPADHSGHSMVEFNIPSNAEGTLVLTVIKDPDVKSMAIEEIEGF